MTRDVYKIETEMDAYDKNTYVTKIQHKMHLITKPTTTIGEISKCAEKHAMQYAEKMLIKDRTIVIRKMHIQHLGSAIEI